MKRPYTDPLLKRPHIQTQRECYTIAFEPIVYKRRKNSPTQSTTTIIFSLKSDKLLSTPVCRQHHNYSHHQQHYHLRSSRLSSQVKVKPKIHLEPPRPCSPPSHSTPLDHRQFDSLDRSKLTPIKHSWTGHIQRKLFKEMDPSELASVTMGRGAFGRVISTSLDNIDFAVKMCPASPCSCRGEQNSLKLNHPNIVTTHEIIELSPSDLSLFFTDSYLSNFNSVSSFKSSGLQMVIMDKEGHLTLEALLRDPNELLPRERRNYFLYQISSALSYCHERRILHLDLKPANIMVAAGDVCKLVDFGCSLKLEPGHIHQGRLRSEPPPGTVPYTSPEIFRGELPTEKADIYSFGILMWQLWSRRTPFSGNSPQVIIFKVCRGVRPVFPEPATMEMSNYMKTAEYCWSSDVSTRPTADELAHRFTSNSPDTGYESITS